jgi:hypothetical protein
MQNNTEKYIFLFNFLSMQRYYDHPSHGDFQEVADSADRILRVIFDHFKHNVFLYIKPKFIGPINVMIFFNFTEKRLLQKTKKRFERK